MAGDAGMRAAIHATTAPPGYVRAAALADLGDAPLVGVDVDGRRVCLVRVGDAMLALDDRCPHAAFPLSEGDLLPDGSVRCAWHGARFDPRTGAVLHGPAHAGACAPAVSLPVLVIDDVVHVRLAP